MLECHLCSDPAAKLDSVNELEAHIAADHFNCLPYWCDNCQFTRLPTEFTLCNHYEKVHGLSEYNIHYRYSREIFLKQQNVKTALKYAIDNKQLNNKHRTASVSDLEQKNSPSQVSIDCNPTAVVAEKSNLSAETCQSTTASVKAPSIEIISIDVEEQETNTPNPFIERTGQAFSFTEDFQPRSSSSSKQATSTPLSAPASFKLRTTLNEVFFGEERAPACHSGGYNQRREYGKSLPYDLPSTSFSSRSYYSPEKATSSSMALLNRCSEVIKEGAMNRFTQAMSNNLSEDGVKSEIITENYSLQDFYVDGSAATDLAEVVSRPGPIIREESPPRRRNPKPAFEKGVLYQCLKCSSRVTGPCIIKHINYKHVKLPFFRCRACNKKSCQTAITSMASHIKLIHNGDMSLLESKYKECSRQIRSIRGQFFDIYKGFHSSNTI